MMPDGPSASGCWVGRGRRGPWQKVPDSELRVICIQVPTPLGCGGTAAAPPTGSLNSARLSLPSFDAPRGTAT